MIRRVVDMFPTLQPLAIVRPNISRDVRGLGIPTVEIDYLQQGAALSILCANGHIDDDESVLIVNSDNIFDCDLGAFLKACEGTEGCIMTMEVDGGPWSYVQVDTEDKVRIVVEKQQISNLATTGAYYFHTWRALRWAICHQVTYHETFRNEFYLAPCYMPIIISGNNVRHYKIEPDQFISLGTPEALQKYNDRWGV